MLNLLYFAKNRQHFDKNCDCRAVQRSALCRSRRELSNAFLLEKFGFDTAENEPRKVCPIESAQPALRTFFTVRCVMCAKIQGATGGVAEGEAERAVERGDGARVRLSVQRVRPRREVRNLLFLSLYFFFFELYILASFTQSQQGTFVLFVRSETRACNICRCVKRYPDSPFQRAFNRENRRRYTART